MISLASDVKRVLPIEVKAGQTVTVATMSPHGPLGMATGIVRQDGSIDWNAP